MVVKGYEDKGKILPVNLRNRPQTPREKEPTSRTGAEIGRLEPGTVIKRAIAVFGNDPFSADRQQRPPLSQQQICLKY